MIVAAAAAAPGSGPGQDGGATGGEGATKDGDSPATATAGGAATATATAAATDTDTDAKEETIVGWQWKRTDKNNWVYFEEEPEKEIETIFNSKKTSWTYKYNWAAKGFEQIPDGEKNWRLSVCHTNPKSGNVYKPGAFYYVIRRIDSGPPPSRDGDGRWMFEGADGWAVYEQARSDEIEEAHQAGQWHALITL